GRRGTRCLPPSPTSTRRDSQLRGIGSIRRAGRSPCRAIRSSGSGTGSLRPPPATARRRRPLHTPPTPTQAVVRTASPPPPARPKPKSPAFALPTAPEERLAALEQYVRERVLQALGRAPSESLDPNVPLSSVGLDSLMVVELKSLVERELSVAVPTDLLLSGPSIAQVALWLRDQLAEGNLAGTPAGMPAKMPTGTLAVTSAPPAQAAVPLTPEAVAGLSDEEVDRLLKLMLKGKGTSK